MNTAERKLTKQEVKRHQKFEQTAGELEADGYIRQDLTVTAQAVNRWGTILVAPIVLLLAGLHFYINGGQISLKIGPATGIYFVLLMIGLTAAHEGIHGCTWAIYAEHHFHSIAFGVMWKQMMPYCYCADPLKKQQYIIGTVMPGVLLGVLPSIYAILSNNSYVFILSLLMIVAACGDFLIVLKLIKYKSKGHHRICMDHPYECGVVVFEKEA